MSCLKYPDLPALPFPQWVRIVSPMWTWCALGKGGTCVLGRSKQKWTEKVNTEKTTGPALCYQSPGEHAETELMGRKMAGPWLEAGYHSLGRRSRCRWAQQRSCSCDFSVDKIFVMFKTKICEVSHSCLSVSHDILRQAILRNHMPSLVHVKRCIATLICF